MPTSKDTRVRVEDFSKIMPRDFPFRGWWVLPCFSIFLRIAERFSIVSMSFGVRSEMASKSFFTRRSFRSSMFFKNLIERLHEQIDFFLADNERRHEPQHRIH